MKKYQSIHLEEIRVNELWDKAGEAEENGDMDKAVEYLKEGLKCKSSRKEEFKEYLKTIEQKIKDEEQKSFNASLKRNKIYQPLFRPPGDAKSDYTSDLKRSNAEVQAQDKKQVKRRLRYNNPMINETNLFEDEVLERRIFSPDCDLRKLSSFRYKKTKHPSEKNQKYVLEANTEGINILFEQLGAIESDQGLWAETYVFLFLLNYYLTKYGIDTVTSASEYLLKEPLDNSQEIKTFNTAFSIKGPRKPDKEVQIMWFNYDAKHKGKGNRDIDVRKIKKESPSKDYYIEVKSHQNKTDVHSFTKSEVTLMLKVLGQQNQKYRVYQVDNVNKAEQELLIHIKEPSFKDEQDIFKHAEAIKLDF